MSNSDGHDFESWIAERYAETNGFTALVLLLATSGDTITPLSSSFVHVVGTQVPWSGMKGMLDGSGRQWDAVAMFSESAPGGGPLIEVVAKARLQQRIDELSADPMQITEGSLFDRRGRAIHITVEDAG